MLLLQYRKKDSEDSSSLIILWPEKGEIRFNLFGVCTIFVTFGNLKLKAYHKQTVFQKSLHYGRPEVHFLLLGFRPASQDASLNVAEFEPVVAPSNLYQERRWLSQVKVHLSHLDFIDSFDWNQPLK